MFRKIPLLVVLLVLVALSGATLLAQEPVTLRFSSFQSGAVVEKWEEQFAEFEAATGIKIVHEFVPWPETVERYLTMAAADDLPDVAMVSAQWHRTLATRGVLSELTQDQFEVLDLDDFWPRLLGAYNYDGVQYGLPTDLDLQLIWYNKDLFDDAGLSFPEAGWNWDDYLATAKALTQGEGVGKTYGSSAFQFGSMRMVSWSYGGDFIDPETGDAAFDTEPVQRAMAFLNTLLVEDESAPLPGTEGVTTDRVAMNMWGPWASWYIMADVEFDWDVVPIPVGTEEVVLAWGSTLAAFKSSPTIKMPFASSWISSSHRRRNSSALLTGLGSRPGMAATETEGFMEEDVLALSADQKQFVIDSVANGRAPFVHREEARLQNIYDQELSLVTSGMQSMDDDAGRHS